MPGEKIPSLRRMHRETGASITSILQAYLLLEGRGLIEAKPQSGYYVSTRPRNPLPAPEYQPPGRFSEEIDEYVVQSFIRATTDPRVLQLAESTPCAELLPTKSLCRIVGNPCRETPERLVLFEHPQGNLQLRKEISKLSLRGGSGLDPEELIVTNGGYEAWNLCFRAVAEPGDTILVDSPTYFGVSEILKTLGLKAVELPTRPDTIVNLPATEALLRQGKIKACFALPQFVKPFDGTWSEPTKQAFVELFARYEIPIIEGDVYRDFYFGTRPPVRLKDYDRKGLVIHCGSFSKTVSSGFRLAWIAPGKYQEKILRLRFLSSISAPTLSQLAVADYLARGNFERHLRLVRRKLLQNLAIYTDAIARQFPKGSRISKPDGGFVLWVQLPSQVDSLELFRRALREDIVVAPGPIFSITGQLRGFIRISFGNSWSPRIEKGISKVAAIANDLVRGAQGGEGLARGKNESFAMRDSFH